MSAEHEPRRTALNRKAEMCAKRTKVSDRWSLESELSDDDTATEPVGKRKTARLSGFPGYVEPTSFVVPGVSPISPEKRRRRGVSK